MNREVKTHLTRDEVVKLLEIYNTIDAAVDDSLEMLDIRLSQLSELRDKSQSLRVMFNFRYPMNEEGNPQHWRESVMPDDPNAFYWKEDKDNE